MNNTGMRRVRRAGAAAFDAAVSNRDENNSVASDKYGKFNAAKARKEMDRAASRSTEDSEQLPLLSEKLRLTEQQTQHNNNRRGPMMDIDHSDRAMQKRASSETAPSSGNSTGSLHQRLQGVNSNALPRKKMNVVFSAFGESPRILKRVKKVMKCNKDDNDDMDKDSGHLDLPSHHDINNSKSMSKSKVILIMLTMVLVVFSMGRRRGRNIEMEKESITLNKMKSHIQKLRGQPVLPSMEDSSSIGDEPNIINSEKIENDKIVAAQEVFFPFYFSSLSNLTEEYRPGEETPYFWDVHFSGESIAEAVFSQCYNLVMAAEFGLRQPDYSEDQLAQFILDGSRYVNVELNTKEGILRASNLGLAQSHLADVIISPYLHNIASSIFTSQNPGRLFAIFRHPVDRAIGLYHYLSKASWDQMFFSENMTIEEFAKSGHIENNFMTRFIIGKPRGKLSHSDMLLAKKIVKYKVLVGLYDELETSMTRFQKYFGWTNGKRTKADTAKCQSKIISRGDKNVLGHPTSIKDAEELETVEFSNSSYASQEVIVGNSAWKAIERQNVYDLELYAFAKRVYALQGEHIFDVAA